MVRGEYQESHGESWRRAHFPSAGRKEVSAAISEVGRREMISPEAFSLLREAGGRSSAGHERSIGGVWACL